MASGKGEGMKDRLVAMWARECRGRPIRSRGQRGVSEFEMLNGLLWRPWGQWEARQGNRADRGVKTALK